MSRVEHCEECGHILKVVATRLEAGVTVQVLMCKNDHETCRIVEEANGKALGFRG